MAQPSSNLCCATLYDKPFAPIGTFCRNTLVRYGRCHGYDVVHSAGSNSQRPHSWHKLLLIESLFDQGYEYVLWVDADAIFVGFDDDIMKLVRPDKDMYMVRHPYQGKLIPNMGIFLLRNCDWSRELLSKMWALEQYIQHPWWENAAFLHLLCPEEFGYRGIHNENGAELDASRIFWLPENWNFLPRQTKIEPPILTHYAAKTRWKRIRKMLFNVNLAHHFWDQATHSFQPIPSETCPMNICVHRISGKTLANRKMAA